MVKAFGCYLFPQNVLSLTFERVQKTPLLPLLVMQVFEDQSQLTFTCTMSTIETLEKGVKYGQNEQ